MEEKTEFVKSMFESWQNQMQQYLDDPKTSSLIIEQYIKAQEAFEHAASSFATTQKHDNDIKPHNDADLADRLNQIDARLYAIERILSCWTKDSSKAP